MKVQEIYSCEITGATSEGLGVAHLDGRAVFIPGAIPGEQVRFRLTKVGHNVVLGELLEVERPSPGRVAPECPAFGTCGGCAFWHMDYKTELSIKRQRVADALRRIGGIDLPDLPITGAQTVTGYRNKAQYPVAVEGNKPVAGFYRARSHEVVPIARCRIQAPQADACRDAVVSWMRRFGVPAYDERTGSGLVRHIYVRSGADGEVLLCVVANGDRLPHEAELVAAAREAVPAVRSVVLAVNTRPGNAVLGRQFRTLYGPGWIEDTLCGLRFRLSPRSFYQVNHAQAERLYEAALDAAQLSDKDTVLDLYCGTGTITLCLARRAGRAIGVEVVEEAIADAKENARRNGIENARFFCADAGQAAQRLADEGTRPDVIVVDPPRKGLSGEVIDAMARMAPERIVYVSCDPATLARDAALLTQRGYTAVHAQAFDLFPRCAHVETVLSLVKTTA